MKKLQKASKKKKKKTAKIEEKKFPLYKQFKVEKNVKEKNEN